MQSLTLEREFQMCEIAVARPVGSRIGLLGLFWCDMRFARAVSDEGDDVVRQAIEAMPLPEQEVSRRVSGVGDGRSCQSLKRLPALKIDYQGLVFEKNHYPCRCPHALRHGEPKLESGRQEFLEN